MQRSSVLKYILKRLVMAIFVLFLVSVIIFIAIRLAPGDPVLNQLGPYGERTPEREAAVRAQLGLDKSYVEQYFIWIGNVFRGNFGVSLNAVSPVSPIGESGLARTSTISASAVITSCLSHGMHPPRTTSVPSENPSPMRRLLTHAGKSGSSRFLRNEVAPPEHRRIFRPKRRSSSFLISPKNIFFSRVGIVPP